MNNIKVNVRPIENDETFLLILPSRQSYEVGSMYHIIDFFSDEIICYKCLGFKETLPISQLTDMHTFLSKNMHKDLFYSVIKNQFKTRLTHERFNMLSDAERIKYKVGDLWTFITKDTLVDVCVFTNFSNVKAYDERVKHSQKIPEISGESLLSKKQILTSKYCHKSLWNFEHQRPYTEIELIQLKNNQNSLTHQTT